MKLVDYNRCPSCGRGEMHPMGNVDMCTVCRHTIRTPSTTELWLMNLPVGDVIYIKGMEFVKIEAESTGKKYWQGGPGNAWYQVDSLLHTFGNHVEVRCAS